MNTVNKNPKRNFQSDGNIATPTAGSQINNAVNNNTNQPPLKGRAKSLQDNNTSSRRPSLLAMIYQALTGRSSRSSNNNINVIDHNANLNINISQQWSAKSMDGSSQASFHRQMRQFKHSQPYNKWTLQFVDPQTEAKFMLYFAKQTLKHWRITVVLMTICQLGLFIASMLNYSAKDAVLQSTYSQKSIPLDQMMDQMTVYCPRGYWCSPCPPNHPCHPYHVGIDAIYMSVLTVICAVSLWLSYRLELERFSQVQQVLNTLLLQSFSVMGLIGRFYHVSKDFDPLFSGLMLIIVIVAAYCGLQISTLYAYWNIGLTLVAWSIFKLPGITDYRLISRESVLYLAALLIVASINTLYLLYRFERHHKAAFLQLQYSMWASSRLQARTQPVGGAKIDIEAPLEKSIGLLKDFISDQTLSIEQRNMITSILQLLNSPQLFSPDIQTQLADGIIPNTNSNGMHRASSRVTLDEEQKAWILKEITKTPATNPTGLVHRKSMREIRKSRRLDASLGYLDKIPANSGQTEPMPVNGMTQILSQSLPNKDNNALVLATNTNSNNIRSEPTTVDNNLSALAVMSPLPLISVSLGVNTNSNLGALKIAFQFVQAKQQQSSVKQSANSLVLTTASQKRRSSGQSDNIVPLLQQLDNWDWPLHEFSASCPTGKSLFILIWHLFESNGLFEEFNIPIDKFQSFMWRVQEGYRDLPYHNQLHVTDVLHAIHCFTKDEKIQQLMTPLELMALLFAAAVHDLDHPGVNNTFLVTTASPLAIVYNDRAVLENYHVSTAFELLLKAENNFLSHLNKQEWQSFREMVVDLVLGTDLSQHYSVLTLFKTRIQSGFSPGQVRDDRMLLYKVLMKCADVSNPTKEFSIYNNWIHAVLDEWRLQGDQERRLNLTISPFMDRENANVVVSSQTGFIDFIVQPLYDALHSGFMPIPYAMVNLDNNRQHWQKAKDHAKEIAKDYRQKEAIQGKSTNLQIQASAVLTSAEESARDDPQLEQ